MTTPDARNAPAEFVVRPRDELAPGAVLGDRYRIVRAVAAGGFGAVYEARHIQTDRQVAVKVLHAWLSDDPKTRERFRRELQAPAQIRHPGIVEVLDADVDPDGVPFLVMEWIEGEPLRARMKRGRLSLPELRDVFVPFLDALDAAHGAGFVHRDLKPENCMLVRDADGVQRPRLVDFGLARKTGARSITVTGTALGTPRYMSPEQFMNAKLVGPESDVWAVGAMMYEALAGEPPFNAKMSHALMLQILMEPPAPILTKLPDLPPRLAALIERCLDKEPRERPPDAAALRADLVAICAELPNASEETTPGLPRFSFSHPESTPRAQGSVLSDAPTELAMRASPAASAFAPTAQIPAVAPRPTPSARPEPSPPEPPEPPPPPTNARAAPGSDAFATPHPMQRGAARARPVLSARAPRGAKPWWVFAALAGLSLAIGAVGTVAYLWSLAPSPRPPPRAPRQVAPPSEPMRPLPTPRPPPGRENTAEDVGAGDPNAPMAPTDTAPTEGPMDPIMRPLERILFE